MKEKKSHVLDCICLTLSGRRVQNRNSEVRRSFGSERHLNWALKDGNELEWGMGRRGNLVGKNNMQQGMELFAD